jgi:hypothetical protein
VKLSRIYKKQFPNESYADRWKRIYRELPDPPTTYKARRNLREAVRRRRSRTL